MRDKNRIYKFCNEFADVWANNVPDADVWANNVPDWRFGQLICNVFGQMAGEGRDPFFPEENEMIDYFKKYFGIEERN